MTTPTDRAADEPDAAPATRARVAGLALAGLLLAACSAAGSPSPAAPGPTGGPSGSPISPIATVSPSASGDSAPPSPSPNAPTSVTVDGSGDATPGYLDIVNLRIDAVPPHLTLSLDLFDPIPTGSPSVGELAYVFYLDVDGDGTWDWSAGLTLVPGGGFRPSLVEQSSGRRLEAAAFPGTANMAGRTLTMTIPLGAIGCPATVGVKAASQRTQGGTTSGDTVPDAASAWVPVETGC
jgi:hypothetical protein